MGLFGDFFLQCWHAKGRAESKKPASEPGLGPGVPAWVPRRATERKNPCFALAKRVIPKFLLNPILNDGQFLVSYVASGGASTTATRALRARLVLL